jgi:hypothetical protein
MLYVKSIFLGFAGIIVMACAVVVVMIASMLLGNRHLPEGTTIGWDPVSWMQQSLLPWLILVTGFAVGFFLGLRWFRPQG